MKTGQRTAAGSGSSSHPHPRRLQGLDVLRGVAVMWVIVHHWDLPFVDAASHPLLFFIIDSIHRAGWLGVDLFFVLSGFLVGGLLFLGHRQNGGLNVGRFLVRRGLKIHPAFYAFLGITVLIPLLRHAPVEMEHVLAEALFVQNYFDRMHVHTWSLAVEEHFYLILPVLLTASIWRTRGAQPGCDSTDPFVPLIYWIPAIMACCLLLRIVTSVLYPFRTDTHLFPSHLRLDSLLFGVLLAYFYFYRSEGLQRFALRFRSLLLFLTPALIWPAFFLSGSDFFMHTIAQTCFAAGFSGLLLSVLAGEARRQQRSRSYSLRCTGFIGVHSYSIYLWHIFVRNYGLETLKDIGVAIPPTVLALLYMAASVAIGVLASKLVEAPICALRDQFYPRKRSWDTPLSLAKAATAPS